MATRSSQVGKRAAAARNALAESLNSDEPVFPYPEDLRPEFQQIWRATVNTKPSDYWNAGDIPLLWLYCRCVHDIQRLDGEIDDEGETIENARGNMVVNPKIMIRSFAETRLMTLCAKLHMQPSSRMDTKNEDNAKGKRQRANKAAATISADDDGLLSGAGMPMQ